MSNEKTLDQMLEEMDELLNEESTTEVDPGTIVAVPTQSGIRDVQSIPEESHEAIRSVGLYVHNQEDGYDTEPSWRYRRLDIDDEREIDLNEVVTLTQDMHIPLRRMSLTLGVSVERIREIRQSDDYIQFCKPRITKWTAEQLIDRATRWETPIDTIYARYFGIPIKEIRQILDEVSPRILEVSNRKKAEKREELRRKRANSISKGDLVNWKPTAHCQRCNRLFSAPGSLYVVEDSWADSLVMVELTCGHFATVKEGEYKRALPNG